MLVTLLEKEGVPGRLGRLRPLSRVGTLRTLGRRSHP
jgi:hypothetical protein